MYLADDIHLLSESDRRQLTNNSYTETCTRTRTRVSVNAALVVFSVLKTTVSYFGNVFVSLFPNFTVVVRMIPDDNCYKFCLSGC